MADVPLSVLDLVPVSSGSDVADAVRNTVDLARRTEEFGCHRYWFAEHHLNPGVAGASPPVLIALVAGATERIRLGSAGVQLAHRTPLAVVEEFGLSRRSTLGGSTSGSAAAANSSLANTPRRHPGRRRPTACSFRRSPTSAASPGHPGSA